MKKLRKIGKVIVPAAMLALPLLTLAALPPVVNPITDTNNPLTLAEIQALIERVARFIMIVGIVIAVIAIIWGAIVIITAGGNDDRTKTGKSFIFKGVIGAAVIFGIGIILQTVAGLVTRTFFG